LEKRKHKITDLTTDLKDGILLIEMLEQLSGKEIKHNAKPRMDIQRLENLKFGLDFIQADGVKIVNMGPEDIAGGNTKIILGLIWSMILRYQINTQNDGSANKDLLDWVNSVIPSHPIKNFTKDWQDGKTLCYLVEALRHGSIPMTDITEDKIKNLTNAMTIATDKMEIPHIVDPEDMADHPDSLSNITYISYFREYAKNQKDRELFEMTVVGTECTASGPGLQPGVIVDSQTGFVIEARNGGGRHVPQGGAIFNVKITGPTADVPYSLTDVGDGTYSAGYTATEPGNHFIQITYQGLQIKGSPFQVPITKPTEKSKPKTLPVPHWHYEETHNEGFKQVSKWVPFDDATSHEFEKAFKAQPLSDNVEILNGNTHVDFTKFVEKSKEKKHKRKILRGIWFYQDDDGTWYPYESYCAMLLENEFQSGNFSKVTVCEKPPRWVMAFADGTYKQFRQTKGGNPNGRPVQRGFNGQVTEKN